MADLVFVQQVSGVSISTSTVTLIQIAAPANHRVRIREIGISFQGVVNTNAPIQVQLLLQTGSGTSSAGTPSPVDGDMSETILSGTLITFTGEPTAGAILRTWNVHPQYGIIVPFSERRPPVLKGGTRVGLRVVSPGAAVVGSAYIECEE